MGFHQRIHRMLPDKNRLRKTLLYRLFGKNILAGDLWRFDARSVAAGWSMGLFIALTPTIPFQMILATLGALCLRVNLPMALLACWVTNPLTSVPFYMAAWQLGRWVLEAVPFAYEYVSAHGEGTRSKIIVGSFCLWTGCLILATLASVVSYVLVRSLWPKHGFHLRHISDDPPMQ
ncbi:MAG TPA: DUF2062 domain-containing protein [Sedimentisphaerales bacterium]|nr:DUF2062 domain-containing protein [Sedimentisphaerales bacterium]